MKLLDAHAEYNDNKDYTVEKLYGQPKEGQSLESVRDLLLSQIDSVKQGRFPDWLLQYNINHWEDRSYIWAVYRILPR